MNYGAFTHAGCFALIANTVFPFPDQVRKFKGSEIVAKEANHLYEIWKVGEPLLYPFF